MKVWATEVLMYCTVSKRCRKLKKGETDSLPACDACMSFSHDFLFLSSQPQDAAIVLLVSRLF